jgi:hypothetical protein
VTEPQSATFGLEIQLGGPDEAAAEELDALTSALRRELLEVTEVQEVVRPTVGTPPEGAKGLDVLAIGTLLVTVARSAGGLRAVTGAIRAWLSGQPDRTVKIRLGDDELVTGGLSAADQERLITAFIERHARP